MSASLTSFVESIFSDMSSPTIIVFILFISLATLIGINFLIPYLYQILRIGYFAYPSSRCMAKQAQIFRGEKLHSLVDAHDSDEIIHLLEAARYIEVTQKTAKALPDAMLDQHIADTYAMMYMIAPSDVKELFHVLKYRIDIMNIKRYFIQLQNDTSSFSLIHKGNLDHITSEMYENIDSEISSKFMNTPFYPIVDLFTKKPYDILRIEHELNQVLFSKLWKQTHKIAPEDARAIKRYVGVESEIHNLLLVIRKIIDNSPFEDIKEYIIPFGYDIAPWRIESMLESATLEEITTELHSTRYGPYVQEALNEYRKTNQIHYFELYLMKLYEKTAHEISTTFHLSIGPLLGYLMLKEVEIKNIRTIMTAKDLLLSEDEIYTYLITPMS